MNDKAIGVFDSGLGGLTSVTEVSRLMPNENIIYLGDTANAPYGIKSPNEIIKLANKNIEFLKSKNVKIILAACGTVSSYLDCLDCDVPIVEIIKPTCKKAVEVTKNRKIAVMATPTAIMSGSYKRCISDIADYIDVYQQPCEKLATLIENGHVSSDDLELDYAVKNYVEGVNNSDVDTLILGCTHYPIVENSIFKHLKNKYTNIINAGKQAVEEVKNIMVKNNLLSSKTEKGYIKYFVSGDTENFKFTANKIFNNQIINICHAGGD